MGVLCGQLPYHPLDQVVTQLYTLGTEYSTQVRVRENSKIWPFLVPRGITSKEFYSYFRRAFEKVFLFTLRPIGARIEVGVQLPPPSVDGGKSGMPVGRGLNLGVLRLEKAHKTVQKS